MWWGRGVCVYCLPSLQLKRELSYKATVAPKQISKPDTEPQELGQKGSEEHMHTKSTHFNCLATPVNLSWTTSAVVSKLFSNGTGISLKKLYFTSLPVVGKHWLCNSSQLPGYLIHDEQFFFEPPKIGSWIQFRNCCSRVLLAVTGATDLYDSMALPKQLYLPLSNLTENGMTTMLVCFDTKVLVKTEV